MEYKDLSPAIQSEEQLRRLIEEKIAKNEMDFPSERTLENELGVSRTTLRRSLDTLEKEAVIKKRSRKGIEINPKKTINILQMNSMSSQLPTNQTVVVFLNEITEGVEEVNRFLKIAISAPLFKIARLRIVEDSPFSYEISYLDSARFSGIEKIDFNNTSLYRVLEERYHIKPTYGREELRFVSATEELASILKRPEKTPLFEVVSKAFDQNDEPFEYSKQYLIGDQMKYKINAKNIFDYLEDE